MEKRLRRDLHRTRALLADLQLLLAAPADPAASAAELERLRRQVGDCGGVGVPLPLPASSPFTLAKGEVWISWFEWWAGQAVTSCSASIVVTPHCVSIVVTPLCVSIVVTLRCVSITVTLRCVSVTVTPCCVSIAVPSAV